MVQLMPLPTHTASNCNQQLTSVTHRVNFGGQDGLEGRRIIGGNHSVFRRNNVSREVLGMEEKCLVQLAQVLRQLYGGYDRRVRREIHCRFHDSAGDDEVDVRAGLSEDGRDLLRPHSSYVDVSNLEQVITAVQPAILQMHTYTVLTWHRL